MNSLAYIPASDGAANASLMTVTDVRSPGATTLQVNTVANAPVKFYASYGTPHTFTDPVTGETITVISEATAVDFAGTIDGSNVEIVEIAPGYTDNGNEVGDIIVIRPVTEWANNIFNILSQAHNDDGTLKATPELIDDFVVSGGVVAQVSGRDGSFTDIVYYIGGSKRAASGIANKTYTASKDTYVDIDATGAVTYTEVANNATAPALATDSIRIAKVVTNSSAITSVVQNRPDGLGNWIRPDKPSHSDLDTGWIAFPLASGWTARVPDIRYRRKGDICYIEVMASKNSTASGNFLIGTLPIGFRKGQNGSQYFPVTVSSIAHCNGYTTPDGEIYIYFSEPSGQYISLDGLSGFVAVG